MTIRSVTLFILNYNGRTLLQECLPSLIDASHQSRRRVKLVVIDNHSTDDSASVMSTLFAGIPFIRSRANRFLSSFNEFVERDTSDAVILLNNDIKADADFIDPLADLLENRPDAFFASPICWDFDRKRYEGGLSVLRTAGGWWGTRSVLPPRLRPSEENFWYTVSMGACLAVRRDRFLELGGYDDLYLPGILEDLDLCYRAWKRGWKGYFVPASVVYHKGQASFAPAFGKAGISRMAARNTLFFMWKNLRDPGEKFRAAIWLPVRLLWALLRGNAAFIRGVRDAWAGRSKVLSRASVQLPEEVSDREIVRLFRDQNAAMKRLLKSGQHTPTSERSPCC
ncbi:MAG: glycosyltransferase family 2 protein [Candidatus Omnitrophica bacterium]|nr:glycosyltransferase family 2 protein [Candidatus Omnitrophota bacterium]